MAVLGNHLFKRDKPRQKWELQGRDQVDRLQDGELSKRRKHKLFQHMEPKFPIVSIFKKFLPSL